MGPMSLRIRPGGPATSPHMCFVGPMPAVSCRLRNRSRGGASGRGRRQSRPPVPGRRADWALHGRRADWRSRPIRPRRALAGPGAPRLPCYTPPPNEWGYSSAGRASEWHVGNSQRHGPSLPNRARSKRIGDSYRLSVKDDNWEGPSRRYHAGGGTLRTFGSHRIRHATALLLVNNGMPLEEVSRYLGHSSTMPTRRYAQQTPDALGRRAAEALARAGLVAS